MMQLADLLGIGSIADAVKAGEWIAAAFAALAWAFNHPSTGAWILGGILVLAVLHKGWPFSNVPNVDSVAGKAILWVGLGLLVGGLSWRAIEIFHTTSIPVKHRTTTASQPSPQGTPSPAPATPAF